MTPEQLERHYLKTLNARILFLQEKVKTRTGKEVSYILSEIDALRWALNIIDAYKVNNHDPSCDAMSKKIASTKGERRCATRRERKVDR